jgi:prepilin-type N-terminal cleavage/methylation domain-containing protein
MRQRAFTLIELMIVLAIVSILISLVGPLTIDSLNKARARSELLTFQGWIKYVGNKSFISGGETLVSLKGKSATEFINGQQGKTINFDQLFFQPQDIVINPNGFMQPAKVSVFLAKKEIEMTIGEQTRAN